MQSTAREHHDPCVLFLICIYYPHPPLIPPLARLLCSCVGIAKQLLELYEVAKAPDQAALPQQPLLPAVALDAVAPHHSMGKILHDSQLKFEGDTVELVDVEGGEGAAAAAASVGASGMVVAQQSQEGGKGDGVSSRFDPVDCFSGDPTGGLQLVRGVDGSAPVGSAAAHAVVKAEEASGGVKREGDTLSGPWPSKSPRQ